MGFSEISRDNRDPFHGSASNSTSITTRVHYIHKAESTTNGKYSRCEVILDVILDVK